MGTFWRYFRRHRWQRRIITGTVMAILGIVAVILVWPVVRERRALDALKAPDPLLRERALLEATRLGQQYPGFVARLQRNLDVPDDRQFSAIVETLNRLGQFGRRQFPAEQERYWAISLEQSQTARNQLVLLHYLTLYGHDNAHVRRGLVAAMKAQDAQVREAAAVLAGRAGDDQALLALLDDGESLVRAAAALAAVVADRRRCRDRLAELIQTAQTDDESAAAALGLWKWSSTGILPVSTAAAEHGLQASRATPVTGPTASRRVASGVLPMLASADESGKAVLRDLLLCVVAQPGGQGQQEAARSAVLDVLGRAAQRKQMPSAMAFVAAGRLGIRQAEPFVLAAIDDCLDRPDKQQLTDAELESLAAAVNAARRLGLNQPQCMSKVLTDLWHPRSSLAMILAAEALGQMRGSSGVRPVSGAEAATTAQTPELPKTPALTAAIDVLRRAAEYSENPMPVPLAAAAVALFQIDPDQADEAILTACQAEALLAGDYVAWKVAELARAPGPRARQYAAAWRLADELANHSFSLGARSSGAMLQAFLARGTARASAAADGIQRRLLAQTGASRNPVLAGSYQCALLVLGRQEYAGDVIALSQAESFPRNRSVTALLLAGEEMGLERIFAGPTFDPAWIDSFLTLRLMADVLEKLFAALPLFDIDAPPAVRLWQCRMLRDEYLIHRDK